MRHEIISGFSIEKLSTDPASYPKDFQYCLKSPSYKNLKTNPQSPIMWRPPPPVIKVRKKIQLGWGRGPHRGLASIYNYSCKVETISETALCYYSLATVSLALFFCYIFEWISFFSEQDMDMKVYEKTHQR
jgi:hypothetical protein